MDADDEGVVRLNVGGSLFSTTKKTLLSEPNSIFTKIFDNIDCKDDLKQYSVLKLNDGTLFIDRDGFLFTYVLEFLRLKRLVLPEGFQNLSRLREEAKFYHLDRLEQDIISYNSGKYAAMSNEITSNSFVETGGYITIGYRGTFAFGRDGQADVKFRKLHRILVCGKVALCKEVFGDTLNESRDPDREGQERYTSRLYLKHQCLEKACDVLAEKGFKLIATCCSGANGLITSYSASNQASMGSQQEFINQRSTGDLEEQRWAHYNEYVFYREFIFPCTLSPI